MRRAARRGPRAVRQSPLGLAALALAVQSCGLFRGEASDVAGKGGSPVEVHAAADHPALSVVFREGDPFAAVAVGVTGKFGAVGSLWLSSILEDRLSKTVPGLMAPRANGAGFVIAARARVPADAERFVVAVNAALATKIAEADRARARERVRGEPALRAWRTPSERAIGECSGELGAVDPALYPTAVTLDGFRAAAYSSGSVAFAAVGPKTALDAASDALGDTAPWPRGEAGEDWPDKDVAGTASSPADAGILSVALRLPDRGRALSAARSLGLADSAFVAHAGSLDPSWTVSRITAIARPVGACLRIDLTAARAAALPTVDQAAGVAAMVVDEANRAFAAAPNDEMERDRGIFEAADPRDAAGIAAWQALRGRADPGPAKTFVSYGAPPDPRDPTGDRFARAFGAAHDSLQNHTLEVSSDVERGQGELWALIGSPCATLNETAREAGATALAMRALANRTPVLDGVRIEPWVSSYGVGLLAHAARRARESAGSHAERVGRALGRVFATEELADHDVALARADVQKELYAETEPLWPVELEALAPGHPSWLDPRGTWQSVTDLSVHAIDNDRHALVRGPLRLAVIANADPAQSERAQAAVERWLAPERAHDSRCPKPAELASRPGEYDAALLGSGASRALVGVTLPEAPGREIPREAEWLAYLLNAPDGWLKRAVETPGLAANARAVVLGGSETSALVVDIAAAEQGARDATSQVRALLTRLSQGAISADDFARAAAALGSDSPSAVADPRQRLARRFLGGQVPKDPDLGSLRELAARAFAQNRHVVVVTKPR